MLGVFFANKVDRRSSFLPQMRALKPLKKTSPTSGFYEFGIDLYFERGVFVRTSAS
jgi:hypothetical protein